MPIYSTMVPVPLFCTSSTVWLPNQIAILMILFEIKE
jgi:hypothetical protein